MNIPTRTLIYINIALTALLCGFISYLVYDFKSININDLNTASNYIANAVTECE